MTNICTISTSILFNFAKNCKCCERHQKDKPCSLYAGWEESVYRTTGIYKDYSCKCTCRQLTRELARNDNSEIEIYYSQETTDVFVRLPDEKVPEYRGLVFLATARRDRDIMKIDARYLNHIYNTLGDFELSWIYSEIRNKIGDAWGGNTLASRLERKRPREW